MLFLLVSDPIWLLTPHDLNRFDRYSRRAGDPERFRWSKPRPEPNISWLRYDTIVTETEF